MSLREEVIQRFRKLLNLVEGDASIELLFGSTIDVRISATSEAGDAILEILADNPKRLCAVGSLAPIAEVHLRKVGGRETLGFKLADEVLFPGVNMKEELKTLIPLASALKASVFIIDFDGTYLEYIEGGHRGATIVGYDEMIGSKAIEKLPSEMRDLVQHYHDRAVETLETQEYIYTSVLTGKRMKSLAIPYGDFRQVALFVMDAQEAVIPALK
jgi:hypothetical protein